MRGNPSRLTDAVTVSRTIVCPIAGTSMKKPRRPERVREIRMADGTSKTGSMKRLASQRSRTAFLLCLPLMLLVAGFVVYPAFYALYLSMLNKKMTAFVGLGNFAFLPFLSMRPD
mgnify:FL=1